MRSKSILVFFLASFFICQIGYSQIFFSKNIDDKDIVAKLFETKYNEVDSTFKWIPNLSESIQFGSTTKDTLITFIDTVFNYNEYTTKKKIILTSTNTFNNNCHGCQSSLGMIVLSFNVDKDSIQVDKISKFITYYGTWGKAPKKRGLLQLDKDLYCVKITEYYSGMGLEDGITSLYRDCKKIFSFNSYGTNNDAVEFDYQKYKYRCTIRFDKKSNTIKINKIGKETDNSGDIVNVNLILTYKYDGEFLEKISTINQLNK
jgi:hypothetical protein